MGNKFPLVGKNLDTFISLRLAIRSEWLCEKVLKYVPHRQWVFCDKTFLIYEKDHREIPFVSQGKRNHNICGLRLDCSFEVLQEYRLVFIESQTLGMRGIR